MPTKYQSVHDLKVSEELLLFVDNELLKETNISSEKFWLGFDKAVHEKYLTHIDIKNLQGLEVELIYNWKIGETLIMDRSHIHCSSSNIKDKKIGLTTFTKK